MYSQISLKILEVLEVSPVSYNISVSPGATFLMFFFLSNIGDFLQMSADLWLSAST